MSLMTGPINVPVYRSGDRWLTWGQVQFRSDTESDRTTSDQSIKQGSADNPMDVLSCLLDNKVVGLRILTSKDPGLVRRIFKDLKIPARFLRDNLIVGHFRSGVIGENVRKFCKWKISENDLVKEKNVRNWTKKCKNGSKWTKKSVKCQRTGHGDFDEHFKIKKNPFLSDILVNSYHGTWIMRIFCHFYKWIIFLTFSVTKNPKY